MVKKLPKNSLVVVGGSVSSFNPSIVGAILIRWVGRLSIMMVMMMVMTMMMMMVVIILSLTKKDHY